MEPSKEFMFKYKGFYFGVNTSAEHVASLENFEIKDSDIFIATYPKSGKNGTVSKEEINLPLFNHLIAAVPKFFFLPANTCNLIRATCPSERQEGSHLTGGAQCLPEAEIIYVTRNPKDVLVSYYHFSKFITTLEEVPDFNIFMERFLAGKVLASSWFDHVAGWYGHAEDFNILFLTYEDMKKDLRSAVLKICNFLGKKLSEEEIESVVRQATFENMKKDPRANYENLPDDIADKSKGRFLRKGTVGDWKNMMTVAQSERFDEALNEKIKTLPIKITWDMNSEK
uniref:Sulfotransferase n=1 Tax=Cairina moschata TaxID=8855 RepID=A0A8C3BSZ1_CAIMO